MYANILTKLKSILDSVAGIGKTYDRLRLTYDDQNNILLFNNSGIFHVWYLTRLNVESELFKGKSILRKHFFRLHGFYALDDANSSAKIFQSLVDTVLNEFQEYLNINILTNSRLIEVPERVEITEETLTNVLCHYCLIPMTVEETKAIERFYFKDWTDCEWILDDNELDKNQLDVGY